MDARHHERRHQRFGRGRRLRPPYPDDEDIKDDEDGDDLFVPLGAILEILLANALGDAALEKLTRHGSFCLAIATGSEDLVKPISQLLDDMADWDFSVSRTSEKLRKRDDYVRDVVVGTLISGGCVLGVAARFELLPDFVLSAVDLKIVLPRLTPGVVADVIETMTGTRVEVPGRIATLHQDCFSFSPVPPLTKARGRPIFY